MGEVNLFAVMIPDELDGIFKHRHHPEAEQIHFNDVHVGTIVLVPLHDGAAGHRRRFEWNDRIQLTLANDHSSGMLPEMPGRMLTTQTQFQTLPNARPATIQRRW